MVCPKCGAFINPGDNFCEECGASLKPSNSAVASPKECFPESEVVVRDSNLAAVTNKGRRHPVNEDAGAVGKCASGDSILIVADGVSSSVNPTTGSQKAVEVIMEILSQNDEPALKLMLSAIRSANASIKNLPFETREDGLYGPETTVVAALVKEDTATIGWVGDSRAYILSKDGQELLTIDDSWVELVVAEGTMTREQASLDKRAHCVTQVLGMHDAAATAHILEWKLKEGDMLLLCSDGLWNYFQSENALINSIIAFGINSDAARICEHLVGLANAAGGHDNITVALYKYKVS
jgi:serine/threonine protein phosphatase PrpC